MAEKRCEKPATDDDRRISITPRGIKFVELMMGGCDWDEAMRRAKEAYPDEETGQQK